MIHTLHANLSSLNQLPENVKLKLFSTCPRITLVQIEVWHRWMDTRALIKSSQIPASASGRTGMVALPVLSWSPDRC